MAQDEFTWEEIESHTGHDDCWIVVNGNVYDVSSFLQEHPGGQSVILGKAGKDCTVDFKNNHNGSLMAESTLEELRIGKVDCPDTDNARAPVSETFVKCQVKSTTWDQEAGLVKVKLAFSGNSAQKWLPRALRSFGNFFAHRPNLKSSQIGEWADKLASFLEAPVLGQHVLVKVELPNGASIVRQYTPISISSDEMELLVKVYRPSEKFPRGGHMSQYLADRVQTGQFLQVRGPLGHIHYKLPGGRLYVDGERKRVGTIGFLCGGSGITPAFQIIHRALRDPFDSTRLVLIYANNSPKDIMLRKELDKLALDYPGRFQLWYTVSNLAQDEADHWKYSVGFIDLDMIKDNLPHGGDETCFVGICGPPPMVEIACVPNLRKHGYSCNYFACF